MGTYRVPTTAKKGKPQRLIGREEQAHAMKAQAVLEGNVRQAELLGEVKRTFGPVFDQ